ncbi:DENN domain-containing protein 1B isoform X4 [Tachysurus vachellii]|uniref:DENN domain-containing protein 1B isoform X4 n=1 Tax=Tachysurus vachellii TaxID=175792 RepID=UPI00296AB376|nr:DENN domain-containing protein 1B isoform X4 [Tachysurus vachellii]
MDSRIRENPERTFDLVLQIACPSSENEDPTVLWKFPQDFGDQEVLQTVPRFCFPFDVERVSQNQVGQNFTFVLTDIESKQRFGFCRLTSGCKVCICLLSYLPWFENYYKLLNTLADYLSKHQENDLNDLLEKLYRLKVPKPDTAVTLSVHLHFVAPDITGLPTIPENRNLTEYFVAVDVNNMLHLYASMLHERRIIITSSKLSTLTACVHGSASMLYPMHWQHIYIPVLPSHLLDYCCAPMPYLIGVHLSLLERVKSRSLEDVIILNVDTNTLESPTDDLHNLPSDVGEPITFSEESFVAHRSSAMKSFLEMAVNLQLFKQFIDGRLAKLNEGRGFTDVFEEEITEGGFCGSNSRSYQQWMHTVKRGVNKASPAVKSAYKIAKVHAKKGLRGVKDKMKLKDTEEEEGGLYCTGSPTSTKSLSPRRLQKRRVSYQHQNYHTYISFPDYPIDMEDELDTASKISSEDSEEVPFYMEDSDDSCEFEHDAGQTGEMNLLEEILDSLSTTTLDHGSKLSSAKSLDFFRSMDELDCCTTSLSMTSPVQTGEVGTATSGDQSGWNMGQDDSAINGKHLPPSPRRQCSTRSLPDSTKPSETISDMRNSLMVPPTQPLACKLGTNASPSVYLELPSDLKLSPESQVTEGSSGLRRKVLSKETLRHYQERSQQGGSNRQPSLLIPWEIENKGNREEGEAKVQEKGLLEEIECRLSAALNSNL